MCKNNYFSPYSKRSKKGDKNGKGLRHFSMKVCEKVQRKGTTSYNEVADELVSEFTNSNSHLAADSVRRCGDIFLSSTSELAGL